MVKCNCRENKQVFEAHWAHINVNLVDLATMQQQILCVFQVICDGSLVDERYATTVFFLVTGLKLQTFALSR